MKPLMPVQQLQGIPRLADGDAQDLQHRAACARRDAHGRGRCGRGARSWRYFHGGPDAVHHAGAATRREQVAQLFSPSHSCWLDCDTGAGSDGFRAHSLEAAVTDGACAWRCRGLRSTLSTHCPYSAPCRSVPTRPPREISAPPLPSERVACHKSAPQNPLPARAGLRHARIRVRELPRICG